MLWCIHVDGTTGNLIYNDQLVVSNGVYVGTAGWPAQLATLKVAPTSVNRIEVSVGSAGVNDFQSIQTLMANYGTNTTSVLYKNFKALKTATGADAIDYDDEMLYDVPTSVEFGQMLSSLGYKVTFCPYQDQSFWQSVYEELGSGIVDAIYLQCYAGGEGNDPGNWNSYFSGLPVYPGLWCLNGDCTSGSSSSDVLAQMSSWRTADGITGGFMWLYDDMLDCSNGGSPADYARAINTAVDPLDIVPAAGFAGVAAYHALSFPASTPFVLSNASPGSISWSVINTSSWLNVSATLGTFGSGATTAVTASLNAAVATNLAMGAYSANLIFSNQTTGIAFTRSFILDTAIENWPVALTGLKSAILASTTVTASTPGLNAFDIPNDYCFYQQGLSGSTRGLPFDGIFASECDSATAFRLGPYGSADALMLGDTYANSGTLTLADPDSFNVLTILAASANGGGQGTLVLNFTDGSKSPAIAFNAQDWFYTVTNVAIQGFGRLHLGSSLNIEDNGDSNPNLYQTTISLAAVGLAKPLASITFSNPAGAGSSESTAIFAVSGMSTSVPVLTPTGLEAVPGTNGTVQLSWNASAGAVNYNVKLASSSSGPFDTIGTVSGAAYLATGLANGSTYYFVVSAVGVTDESADSSPVSGMAGSYLGWALAANPVGYWPLNETSGAVANELVQGSNGFYRGGYTLAAGGMAGAGFGSPHRGVLYNGTSGYTQIPLLIGSTNFSIVFWERTATIGGTPNWYNGKGLVDGDVSGTTGDFGVALAGAKLAFGVGNPDTTLTSIKSINDNVWHQIAVTRNVVNGAMVIYIDGKIDSSTTGPTGIRTNAPSLHIGNIQSGNGFLNGTISDVALYQQALTTNQIAALFSAATGLFYDVTLTNQLSGGNMVLSWPGNGKLLEATNLSGPWTTNAAASPVTEEPNVPQKFYQVQTH